MITMTMTIMRRRAPLAALGAALVAAFSTIQCSGSSSPTQATTMAISGLSLSSSSTTAGATVQGTVSLTAAASIGAVSIALSSGNPAVATVQTPVTVQPGSSSATFTVTAMSAGTAAITASINGSSQSSTLTVTGAPVLSSLSLSAASVTGGNSVTGTVTLNSAAPSGGTVVSLSGGDPLTVPPTVTVPAGSKTATFTIQTRTVGGTISATVGASCGGVSASAVLSVVPFVATGATASFGVSGTNVTDTCVLTNSGNTLACTFNGSTSTAPGTIVAWDWTYSVATTISQTTTGPVLAMPSATCSLLPPPPLPAGATWFMMTVTLKIHDSLGNVSAVATDNGVRLIPQNVCGF
jgi:hypothetical protein